MEPKEAKYIDNLLRRAIRSEQNVDQVPREVIDMLIDRDLIEVVDKRNGVIPYLIKISSRGRDFIAAGGFESEVRKKAKEHERVIRKAENERKNKIEEEKRNRRLILDDVSKIAGIITLLATIIFGVLACL